MTKRRRLRRLLVGHLPCLRCGWLPSKGAAENFQRQRQAAAAAKRVRRSCCQMSGQAGRAARMPCKEGQRGGARQQLHGNRIMLRHNIVAPRDQQQLASLRQLRDATQQLVPLMAGPQIVQDEQQRPTSLEHVCDLLAEL